LQLPTRERNNIYAITADAVDLALGAAGAIGSMMGVVASAVGIGSSGKEESEAHERQEADDAAERVATSLRQEAEGAKPRPRKAHAGNTHVGKKRATKKVKKAANKPRASRKVAT
jgi:hypothetical protein